MGAIGILTDALVRPTHDSRLMNRLRRHPSRGSLGGDTEQLMTLAH
jgi:hypothetical protein